VLRRPIETTSLKGEVKKKHNANGWSFSCFAAHLLKQERFGFSLPAVFIASSQRSLSAPKPAKQNGG
jgi:hypothetical protein